MQYVKLDGIEARLSRLTYGTPGFVCGEFSERVFEAYDLAWDAGFRTFDTANSYGNAEVNFGKWIARSGHRNEMVILDKGCNPGQDGSKDVYSPDTIRSQLALSLERLQTDYVDMYILHRDDESQPIEPIVDVLNEMKARGKVRRFGGSNFRLHRVLRANAYAQAHGLEGFTVLSPNYCLAYYAHDPWGGSVSISGDENRDYRAWLIESGTPVFNYSGLGRGYLSGKYVTDAGIPIEQCLPNGPIWEYHTPENVQRLHRAEMMAREKGTTVAQIALAWLLNQKINCLPIICPTGEEHIADTLKALEIPLSESEGRWLYYGEENASWKTK